LTRRTRARAKGEFPVPCDCLLWTASGLIFAQRLTTTKAQASSTSLENGPDERRQADQKNWLAPTNFGPPRRAIMDNKKTSSKTIGPDRGPPSNCRPGSSCRIHGQNLWANGPWSPVGQQNWSSENGPRGGVLAFCTWAPGGERQSGFSITPCPSVDYFWTVFSPGRVCAAPGSALFWKAAENQ